MQKTDIAYDYIKNKIINAEIEPSVDISEEDIRQELEISRTPIREALLRLSKEGFIVVYPRKGTFVTGITTDYIKSVFETRILIEPFIFKQATYSVDKEWLERLRDELVSMADYTEDINYRSRLMELDNEFHESMIKYSNNPFLTGVMKNIYDHGKRIRLQSTKKDFQYNLTVEEHVNIIDAMLKQDAALVEKLVYKHIDEARIRAINYLLT